MSEIPRCATCNHRITEHGSGSSETCAVEECHCPMYLPKQAASSGVHWLQWAMERSGGSVTLTRAECLVLLTELGANASALEAGALTTPEGRWPGGDPESALPSESGTA